MNQKTNTIAVIGLGYVGLPLAVEFAKHDKTIGFDINSQRINELKNHNDSTLEVSEEQLKQASDLILTDDITSLGHANIYIITVPTPVDENNLPELTPLKKASKTVARFLNKGDIVVYESTVYPGATETECASILAKDSGLGLNTDFYVGYSPERINPGDKEHTLNSITKVVAGSTPEVAEKLKTLYEKVIDAGVYIAPSIKVAEAAKAIENTQRDVNIAFMNELSMMFREMGIDVLDVIETAATKWNFLKFTPGLVGGHCIGVDPYYLIHKSQECGYFPQLITTARRLNENMSGYVTERLLKLMALKKMHVIGAKILIMGITFKENCPDLRNTRIIEIINELKAYHAQVDVYDPWADKDQAKSQLGIDLLTQVKTQHYDMAVMTVAHRQFIDPDSPNIRKYLKKDGLIFDLKGALTKSQVDERL